MQHLQQHGTAALLLRAVTRSVQQLHDAVVGTAAVCASAPSSTLPAAYGWAWSAVRHATKKAGGSAHQAVGSRPKHLGAKMTAGELAFPGMIIMRQRGTKFHCGPNTAMGRDHTIFSTNAGHVRFERTVRPSGWERRLISVEPLTNDAATLQQLVERRARIKRGLLGSSTPFEPALYFSLPQRNGRLSWVGQEGVPPPLPTATPTPPTVAPGPKPAQPGRAKASAKEKSAAAKQ